MRDDAAEAHSFRCQDLSGCADGGIVEQLCDKDELLTTQGTLRQSVHGGTKDQEIMMTTYIDPLPRVSTAELQATVQLQEETSVWKIHIYQGVDHKSDFTEHHGGRIEAQPETAAVAGPQVHGSRMEAMRLEGSGAAIRIDKRRNSAVAGSNRTGAVSQLSRSVARIGTRLEVRLQINEQPIYFHRGQQSSSLRITCMSSFDSSRNSQAGTDVQTAALQRWNLGLSLRASKGEVGALIGGVLQDRDMIMAAKGSDVRKMQWLEQFNGSGSERLCGEILISSLHS
jgi:hypothetical protein